MNWKDYVKMYGERAGDIGPTTFSEIEDPSARRELSSDFRSGYMTQPVAMGQGVVADQAAAARQAAQNKLKLRMQEIENQQGELESQYKASGLGDYQKVKNEVGGWTFLDPEGAPITAWQYSLGKGVSVNKALADSDDIGDKQFVNNYETLEKIANYDQNDYADWAEQENEKLKAQKLEPIYDPKKPVNDFVAEMLDNLREKYSQIFYND